MSTVKHEHSEHDHIKHERSKHEHSKHEHCKCEQSKREHRKRGHSKTWHVLDTADTGGISDTVCSGLSGTAEAGTCRAQAAQRAQWAQQA